MNKRDLSRQRTREKALFLYCNALERGDFETVAAISKLAETDPVLDHMITEVSELLEGTSSPPVQNMQPRRSQGVEPAHIPSPNGQSRNHDHHQEKESDMMIPYKRTIHQDQYRLQFLTAVAAALILLVLGAVLLTMLPKPDFQPLAGLQATDEPYAPVFDPANFVEGINHPYFTLTPGTTYVYEGQDEDNTEHNEITVMPETKPILGIPCTVVRDTVWVDGVLVEDTFDWYAQDKDGNVWYMGEATQEYEEGVVVSTAGSWEAGVDGAQPGIIMQAEPHIGDRYRQEYYAGEAEDMAEVLHLSDSASVTYGTFDHVLVTKEWSPLQTGVVEHKYYAPGVGLILEVVVEGGSGRVELVEVITGDRAAVADDNDDEEDDAEEAPGGTPIISAEAALQAAQTRLGSGSAHEVELEFAGGRWVYSVEIGTDEVTVDAINGEVLTVATDED